MIHLLLDITNNYSNKGLECQMQFTKLRNLYKVITQENSSFT